MSLEPIKGYRALRQGRISAVGSNYFITFCTGKRLPVLAEYAVANALLQEMQRMQSDEVWQLRCVSIMPDHVHLLIRLGSLLSMEKSIARLKAKTASILKLAHAHWQAGFHDHLIRNSEEMLPYFIYTFLNPYRAKLIAINEEWPWFLCGTDDRKWFLPYLNAGLPEPAWLGDLP